jgi:DNA-binding transcriptional regulator YiaG
MTPSEFAQARQTLGLRNADLARMLGLSPTRAAVTFSEWEAGRKRLSPSHALLLRAYLDGYRPPGWPETQTAAR